MKKFFGIGLLALLTTAYFTSSCSRDDLSGSMIEAKRATFNDNFIAEYGNIAPNHDWGFGTSNGTRAFTRAITPGNQHYSLTSQPASNPSAPEEPSFRRCPAKPTFNESAPTGTPEATSETSLENDGTYIIKTGDLKSPQNYKNLTFYVQADIDYSSQPNTSENGTTFIIEAGKTLTFKYSISENVKIYMAPGSHLVIDDNLTFKNTILYVGNNCTVTCSSVLFGAGSTVLNESAATNAFTATQLNIEESTLFYNNGNLKATTGIMVQKNYNNNGQAAELVNNGSLTTNKLECQAGGAMLNEEECTTTVNGLTYLYNTNSYWENKGIYNTYDFEINSIDQVWNKCKLTVHKADNTGTFKIAGNSHTSFVLDGGVSVQTDKMDFGNNADFYMKGNSMLEVLGECHSLNANKNHGIHGLDVSIYSIFKAGSVTSVNSNNDTQNCMNYYGRVWVDTESHFEQVLLDKSKLDEPSDQPTYYFESNVKFKFAPHNDPCPITSPITGNCHHGYNTTTTTTEIVLLQSGRVFCEDLGSVSSSDIDYNDVVFDAWIYVKRTNGDKSTDVFHCAFVQLLAAGGTIPVQVAGEDVHKKFGVAEDVMINTYREGASIMGSGKHAEYGDDAYISFPAKIVITDADMVTADGMMNVKNIPITVRTYNNTAFELNNYNEVGFEAPLKFMAPIGTKWAAELVKFGNAYEFFSNWVSDKDYEPWNYPNSSLTYEGIMPDVSEYAPTEAEIAAANPNSGDNNNGNGGNNNGNTNGGDSGDTTPPNVTGPTGHTATWSGTQEFTVNANGGWDGNVEFTLENCIALNAMGVGTYIDIYGYGTSNDWRIQTARQETRDDWTWTDLTNYQRGGSTVNTSTVIEFGPLTAAEVQAIRADGKLVVYGKNFVVKYIDIDNSSVQSGGGTTLWGDGGTSKIGPTAWNIENTGISLTDAIKANFAAGKTMGIEFECVSDGGVEICAGWNALTGPKYAAGVAKDGRKHYDLGPNSGVTRLEWTLLQEDINALNTAGAINFLGNGGLYVTRWYIK